jgi:NTP pyrophosphatase (non-canonical NTP hydrolase)
MIREDDPLKKIQEKIDDWIKNHGGYWPPLAMLSAITEELGELSREINALEGFKPKKRRKEKTYLGEELADLLFSIICVANHYDIDLNSYLERIILKYTKRDANRFVN